MYKTENYGIFLGLLTMPFGQEKDFIKYEIENLFEQYKENVRNNLNQTVSKNTEFSRYLYRPRPYCLFGSFDLAVISLVDDFGLATRHFHPFSPLVSDKLKADKEKGKTDYSSSNYTFHVISGLAPDLRYIDSKESKLLERARQTFLNSRTKDYPFIGITSLKVNNALLIGGGGDTIDIILQEVQSVLSEAELKDNTSLNYCIFHSLSWHELTIVFFSNSYEVIAEQVFALRKLTLKDTKPRGSHSETRKKIYDDCKRDSLLYHFLESEKIANSSERAEAAHLFVHTHTIFGYDLNILFDNRRFDKTLDKKLNFQMNWDIKPGHLSAFRRALEAKIASSPEYKFLKNGRITAGRGDYTYTITQNAMEGFRKLIKVIIGEKDEKYPLKQHIRQLNTVPEFTRKFPDSQKEVTALSNQYPFHDYLHRFQFKLEEIESVRSTLKRLRVSKVVREKVSNMYTIYNDGISDKILYGYFIELKPFLEMIREMLKSWIEKADDKALPVFVLSNSLDAIAQNFETAYQNRFGQSYIMNEITDHNLKFNGGIQQLVTAYDGAYKSLTTLLGERFIKIKRDMGLSIAYVSGFPNIESDILSVRLNYFHLYQPEFFAAAATHEAANFFFERWYDTMDEKPELENIARLLKDDSIPPFVKSTIQYFFSDTASFHLTYADDFELFFYWHWCSIIQIDALYRQDGSIYQPFLDHFILRMRLIAHYTNNQDVLNKMISPPFGCDQDIFVDVWDEVMDNSQRNFEELEENYGEYLKQCYDLVLGFLVMDFAYHDKENFFSYIQETIKKDSPFTKEIDDYHDNQKFDFFVHEEENQAYTYVCYARQIYLRNIASEIIKSFKRGELYNFDHWRGHLPLTYSKDQEAFFFQALSLAYLKLVQELCGNQAQLLKRAHSSNCVEVDTTNVSLWFDPLGGVFTTKLETRKLYYKYRVIFLKSLWNLSMKRKRALFGLEGRWKR